MKETGHPTLQELSFTPYHHHFGPVPLETLPEEEGDDTGEECENFRSESGSPLTPDYPWPPSGGHSDDLEEGDLKISCPTIRHEIERQRAKVLLLESTIGQLQEELRESKDQNELLEFRLLELGDLEASNQSSRVVDVVGRCSGRKSVDSAEDSTEEGVEGLASPTSQTSSSSLYEAEASSSSPEVTNNEERSSNGHASVTEARSSCSDCSESLSFQESGIFESQFSEDSFTSSLRQCTGRGTNHEDLGNELSRLVIQLEDLVTRIQQPEEANVVKEMKQPVSKVKPVIDPNLPYEFLICRQKIQEFERKLRKHGNVDYVQSLENKISLLLTESQKLEEEKAEMEEAENDSRNLCQRYEEKLKRTKQKKRSLEVELCEARDYVEQLSTEIQILEDKEERLTSQLSLLESKIQNQEQQNFDLEESNMELKDSIQFLLQSIPALLAWVIWKSQKIWKHQNFENRKIWKSQQRFPALHAPRSRLLSLPNRSSGEPSSKSSDSAILLHSEKTKVVEVGIQTCPKLLAGTFSNDRILSAEYKPVFSTPPSLLNPSRSKYSSLQEDWEALIKALDELEVERSKNSNDAIAVSSSAGRPMSIAGPKLKGTLVANRIRSLFPTELTPKIQHDLEESSSNSKILRITNQITQKVRELCQTDKSSSVGSPKNIVSGALPAEPNATTGSASLVASLESRNQEIVHLTTEVNRLRSLLQEEEKSSWNRIEKLESDNAQLREALTTAIDLKSKLDDAKANAKKMMNRVEELEQSEMNWREKLKVEERKEKRHLERICGLRAETEAVGGRLTVLQNELEAKVVQEGKFKQEIQILQTQLKDAGAMIQDKEDFLNRYENEFQEKISKLEFELAGSQREVGELECSNGMLREEVLYLEKTLTEVTERVDESEKLVQILNSKVDELQKRNAELKKQIAEGGCLSRSNFTQSNDLEAFAKNEGGLKGVCWHVKDVMATIETCILCKSTVGPKLREVSEQLTTLTIMLEGSQAEGHLSRCESEEHLSPSLPSPKWNPNTSTVFPWRCHLDENKALKLSIAHLEAELYKKDETLRKLKGLDELRIRREKDLRESHLNESWWWKLRCDEKNEIIQILARRIGQLSTVTAAVDVHGVAARGNYVLDQVLQDIRSVAKKYPVLGSCSTGTTGQHLLMGAAAESSTVAIEDFPLDTTSLLTYFESEQTRIREILKSSNPVESTLSGHFLDFRVLRRIGDDALLVSWCANPPVDGYEISVNGASSLRVPKETRRRALLHGLDTTEPLQLTLRVDGVKGHHETSITYIA